MGDYLYISSLEHKITQLEYDNKQLEKEKEDLKQLLRECKFILAAAEFKWRDEAKQADELYDKIKKALIKKGTSK